MANSKVVLGNGTILIDLTADTVDASHLLTGYTAHGADGEAITGSCDFDSDTSDDTAQVSEVLSGKTFHARGTAYTGTMTNRGSVTGVIETFAQGYTIPQGYHDGSGTVNLNSTDLAKVTNPANIKAGVEIGGVTGTYSGEAVSVQSKSATPTFSSQTILPDTGFDYLSQVTVSAISVVYSDNAAGGQTVTIG